MIVATLYILLLPLLVCQILHSWVSANLLHHPQALLLFSTSVRYPMISRKSHSLSILSQPHSPFAYRHRLVIHYMLVYAELGHTMLILYPGLLKKTGIRLLHCLSIISLSLIQATKECIYFGAYLHRILIHSWHHLIQDCIKLRAAMLDLLIHSMLDSHSRRLPPLMADIGLRCIQGQVGSCRDQQHIICQHIHH